MKMKNDCGDIVEITSDELSLDAIVKAVTLPSCGAITTFIG